MVPNTGKSDAEIVFAGVANMKLNNAPATTATTATTPAPLIATNDQQYAQQQHQQQLPPPPNQPVISAASHPQNVELASAATELLIPSTATNVSMPPMTYQQSAIFGTVPPTSIPSLNESFNIPPTINPSNMPASVYQTNSVHGE